MKTIMSLFILSVVIWYTTIAVAQTGFTGQMSHNRQLQVDRYTGYKTTATAEEINPLLVITQINFPSDVKTVYDAINHALQRSGYRVDWQQSTEAGNIFSELEMPMVHRKLNLMTLKDAVATLAGEAWQLLIDSVNRKLLIQLHNHAPRQIADNRLNDNNSFITPQYRKAASHINQTKTEHNTITAPVSASMPMQAARDSFRFGRSDVLLQQYELDEDRVIYDASVNSVGYDNFTDSSSGIEVSVADDTDLREYSEAPSIHRVQYIPGYVQPEHTEMSELDEQTVSSESAPTSVWSVQPIIQAKEGIGSLDEAVIVHYRSISVKELIEVLIPDGWVVHYEVPDAILNQRLVSHAEGSRRNVLLSLFKELNLKALFYPGRAVVLVAERESNSHSYSKSPRSKTMDKQDSYTPVESSGGTPEVSNSQLEVDVILKNAKMIKDLMKRTKLNPK